MTAIAQRIGLRYPDIDAVRWFFKSGFDQERGSVLELGCGNGNNVALFAEYGWTTVGVERDAALLELAREKFHQSGISGEWHVADLNQGIPSYVGGPFRAIVCANVLYYLEPAEAIRCLAQLLTLCGDVCDLLFINRTADDARNGVGRWIMPGQYAITSIATGEAGTRQFFWSVDDWTRTIDMQLRPHSLRTLRRNYQTLHDGATINNADVIHYARIQQ
jgi:SAM-dependent methyltransferase